jgi:transcriptional regulator with XRE-family HTH domain
MQWNTLVSELMQSGMTQQEIGAAVGLSQPAISDIARGVTKSVTWDVGEKLKRLHSTLNLPSS